MESLAGNTSYAEDRPVYERFLSRSAMIISKLVKDKPIGDDRETEDARQNINLQYTSNNEILISLIF